MICMLIISVKVLRTAPALFSHTFRALTRPPDLRDQASTKAN